MITVKLIGGLGNQMFQYATARRLALHHNTDLKLDISGYENQPPGDTPRHYELGNFKVKASLEGKYTPYRGEHSTKPLAKQLGALIAAASGVRQSIIKENSFLFEPRVLSAPDNVYLSGYWQSEKYFKDIAKILRTEFELKNKPSAPNAKTLDMIKNSSAVSLHVRRGDYVTNDAANKFHGTKGLDYYFDSIAHIKHHVKDPHIFVFSDDPKWCQENLKTGLPTTYVTNNSGDKGFEDLRLMSACDHHIIANSSFSWWGAWLNPSPNKIVLAPAKWFNDPAVDTSDIYAEGWIKI